MEIKSIRYISLVYNIPWWFYGVVILIAIISWKLTKRLTYTILFSYIALIIAQTILFRTVNEEAQYNFQLFWSYSVLNKDQMTFEDKMLVRQILFNVVMFIPIGVIFTTEKGMKGTLFGFVVSLGIEAIQFITHRGLFELDDLFHNSVGVVIGALIAITLRKLIRNRVSNKSGRIIKEKEMEQL